MYILWVLFFYEMLTGRLPFIAQTVEQMIKKHLDETAPVPSTINPAIPVEIDHVIEKVLSKESTSRYRTANQFGKVLESIVNSYHHMSAQTSFSNQTPIAPDQSQIDTQKIVPAVKTSQNDLSTLVWALLAFIAVGGLIPLWISVFLAMNSGH